MKQFYLLPLSMLLITHGFTKNSFNSDRFADEELALDEDLFLEEEDLVGDNDFDDDSLVDMQSSDQQASYRQSKSNSNQQQREVISYEEEAEFTDESYSEAPPVQHKRTQQNARSQKRVAPKATAAATPSSSAKKYRSANQANVGQTDKSKQQMPQNNGLTQPAVHSMPMQVAPPVQAVNMPVNPPLKNAYNFWVVGEALYWQAVEDNLTYAYVQSSDLDLGATIDSAFQRPNFQWDWGFRVGAGYNIPRDEWDLRTSWTRILNNSTETLHKTLDSSNQLVPVWTFANNPLIGTPTDFHSHWKVHLNQLDLDLGRQFYVGRHLTLRPNVGVRSTWIKQEFNVTYNTSLHAQDVELKNRFWGFGFLGGVDSDWMFGQGFSLFGNFDFAVLMGYFSVQQSGTSDGSSIGSQSKGFRTGKSVLDTTLGVKWNHHFFGDRLGLTLKAGYEYHLYFNQNQFMQRVPTTTTAFSNTPGDLTYQGVNLSAQIDF